MAAELMTPTDRLTGLPFPILPYDVTGSVGQNYHHHFFPRRSPLLLPGMFKTDPSTPPEMLSLDDVSKIAVRMSRGQVLAIETHVLAHQRLLGPRLPTTLDQRFKTTVNALAGVVPRTVIDPRRPMQYMVKPMSESLFRKFSTTRSICTERAYNDRQANYRRRVFGNFLLRYAIQQDLVAISGGNVIDQFLDAKTEGERLARGNRILKAAMMCAVDPLVPQHMHLRKKGCVLPGRPNLRAVVMKQLRKDQWPSYYPDIESALRAA